MQGRVCFAHVGPVLGTHAVRFSPHWMELASTLFGEEDTCTGSYISMLLVMLLTIQSRLQVEGKAAMPCTMRSSGGCSSGFTLMLRGPPRTSTAAESNNVWDYGRSYRLCLAEQGICSCSERGRAPCHCLLAGDVA